MAITLITLVVMGMGLMAGVLMTEKHSPVPQIMTCRMICWSESRPLQLQKAIPSSRKFGRCLRFVARLEPALSKGFKSAGKLSQQPRLKQ
jgi:hypothetical protein